MRLMGLILWVAFCVGAAVFAFTLDLNWWDQMAAAAFPLVAGIVLPAIIWLRGET